MTNKMVLVGRNDLDKLTIKDCAIYCLILALVLICMGIYMKIKAMLNGYLGRNREKENLS